MTGLLNPLDKHLQRWLGGFEIGVSGYGDQLVYDLGELSDNNEHTYVLNISDWDHPYMLDSGYCGDLKADFNYRNIGSRAVRWALPTIPSALRAAQYYGAARVDNYPEITARAAYVYLLIGPQPRDTDWPLEGSYYASPLTAIVDSYQPMLECCAYTKPLTLDGFENEIDAFTASVNTPVDWAPSGARNINSFYVTPTTYRGIPVGPKGTLSFRVCLPRDGWFYTNTQCLFMASGNVIPRICYDPVFKRLQLVLTMQDKPMPDTTGTGDSISPKSIVSYVIKAVDVSHWVAGDFHTLSLVWDELIPGYIKFTVDADYYDVPLLGFDVFYSIDGHHELLYPATDKRHFDVSLFKPLGTDPAVYGYSTQLCAFTFGSLDNGAMPFGGTIDEIRFDVNTTTKETMVGWHHSGAPFGDIRHFANRSGSVVINDGGIQMLSDGLVIRGTDNNPLYFNSTSDRGDFKLGLDDSDHLLYDRSEKYMGVYGDIQARMVDDHLQRVPYAIEEGYARLYFDKLGNLLVETAEHGRRLFNCGVYLVSVDDLSFPLTVPGCSVLTNVAALAIEFGFEVETPLVGDIQWPELLAPMFSVDSPTFRFGMEAPASCDFILELDGVHLSCERLHPDPIAFAVTLQSPTITVH